jgi:NitT/TauT family transport system permease protein
LITPRSYAPSRAALYRPFSPIDVVVLVAVLVLLYAALRVGTGATASFSPAALEHVSTDPARLPYDAARSLLRMFIALLFSFVFTLLYGYAAARSRRAEKMLVPILDILQSVPVLGFLTVTVTVFIGLFRHSQLGLEAAAIFAIFTAQAWNMTFSFYASLKNLPRELDELSRSLRLTRWQRFWKIEVSSATIGLVWNGMLSFGGAWFFLVASEAITVQHHTYSLPGIGSYVGAAIAKGDLGAVGLAVATMIVMVIAVNVVFWRPLVAWSEKFRYETTEAAETQRSLVLEILARSSWPRVVARLRARLAEPLGRAMRILGLRRHAAGRRVGRPAARWRRGVCGDRRRRRRLRRVRGAALHRHQPGRWARTDPALLRAWPGDVRPGGRAARVRDTGMGPHRRMDRDEPARRAARATDRSGARELPCQLSVPVRDARVHQAWGPDQHRRDSVDVPRRAVVHPFNVIAGASAIPSDLREAMQVLGIRGWQRWKRLIIPGILTSYVTGGITAAGGAWNASIVAEVVTYHHTTLTATGLGAYIVGASNAGNKAKLICGVAVMAVFVVTVNRLFWRRLYKLAETRYSL